MNKTYLLVGGVAAASLATGITSGYLIAKKRFTAELDDRVSREVEETKKYYSVLLMEAKNNKPDSPADLVSGSDSEEDDEEEELSEADRKVIEKGRKTLAEAEQALTNYQGFAQKPDPSALTQNNIFQNAEKPKKKLPPRGDNGKFRKQSRREQEYDPPELVKQEEFLLNELEYEQESLLYFINDKTLVLSADPNESVEITRVGEVNLTLFPEASTEEESVIYVRNDGLSIYYEIKLMNESITEYIGLGENGGDEELDDSAYL